MILKKSRYIWTFWVIIDHRNAYLLLELCTGFKDLICDRLQVLARQGDFLLQIRLVWKRELISDSFAN